MSAREIVHLPDLSGDDSGATGWVALPTEQVSVPSLSDARACARPSASSDDRCAPGVIAFDPPDGTTLIGVRGSGAAVTARLSMGLPPERTPILTLRPLGASGSDIQITGSVQGACRDRVIFPDAVTTTTPDGEYALSIEGCAGPTTRITVALAEPVSPAVPRDRCAMTLSPTTTAVVPALATAVTSWPLPPRLAVDHDGCIVPAWSVDGRGRVLVPRPDGGVELLSSCRGGIIASIQLGETIRDAMFWRDLVVVLTAAAVWSYDISGCAVSPSPFTDGLSNAAALAISDDDQLVVIQRAQPNVIVLRRDGSRVLSPAAFDGRGWYAQHRNPAFAFDPASCTYLVDPARAGEGCSVAAARALTGEEALFFRLVDDLPDLRRRIAYPPSGSVILGPPVIDGEGTPLDAGRPGTQWHRIVLFGEIPEGCVVQIETRAADDLLAGDPLVAAGWSAPVMAGPTAAGMVESPGDTREAAADALVLAGPGRYLWIRLTLKSSGVATPRLSAIEVERPREGTSRYLPKVFRDSTPEDDFLRRWLALFETTAWNGVAGRLDAYPDLFDPRTAPEAMLPYLAAWLELPVIDRVRAEPDRLRRILTHADEIARQRGSIDGLVLMVKLYLGVTIQIVESFRSQSRFVLGADAALGCDTMLSAEPAPVWLGDEARLGDACLLECDERDGTIPYRFDVLVPARAVCKSEDRALLRALVDAEKPAHTTYCIREVAPAGWVVGAASVVGQEIGADFDRRTADPASYGIALLNGPPRPPPIGEGFVLGRSSRLPGAKGQPQYRLEATVGKTTRLGA